MLPMPRLWTYGGATRGLQVRTLRPISGQACCGMYVPAVSCLRIMMLRYSTVGTVTQAASPGLSEVRKGESSDMTEMSEESRAAANVLLAHHREVCRPVRIAADEISDDLVNECTLRYDTVCERAKMP